MQRALGALVAILVLALGLGGWWLTRSPGSGSRPDAGPGTVTSQVALPGPGASELARPERDEGSSASEPEATPEVAARDVVVEADPLLTGPHVRGRVLDGDAPLTEFTIVVFEGNDPLHELPRRAVHNEAFSERADGSFVVPVPAAGTWRLAAYHDGRGTPPQLVEVPQSGPPLVLTLEALVRVRMRVLDPDGLPVAGATVNFDSAREDAEWQTDGNGRLLREGVRPGMYTVMASAPGWAASELLALPAHASTEHEEHVLRLRPPARIHGRVLDGRGQAESGAEVRLDTRDSDGLRDEDHETRTDFDGRFSFDDLGPGTFMVGVKEDIENSEELGHPIRVEVLELHAGEEAELLLSAFVSQPIHVSGVVRKGGLPVSGGSMVTLADGRSLLKDANEVDLDDEGRFAAVLSSAGPFVFLVEVGRQTFSFPLQVPAEGLSAIVFDLPAGSLSGVVLDAEERAMADAHVFLERLDGGGVFEQGQRPRRERSGSDGSFAFELLAPGEYLLRASQGETASATSSVLELSAGGALGPVTLRLVETGKVTLTVSGGEDGEHRRATVYARRAGAGLSSLYGQATDARGRTTFELPVGRYTFQASGLRGSAAVGAVIELTPDNEVQAQLTLEPGAELCVRLLDGQGAPLRPKLDVRDEQGRRQAGLIPEGALEGLLMNGFDSFAPCVGPLPPGRYSVLAQAPDGRSVRGQATLVAGERTQLELRLP